MMPPDADLYYADRTRMSWYPGGDPVTRNSSGGERPRLDTPLNTFVVHYVGAGEHWLDSGDTAQELHSIEVNHAIPNGKPNEYNSASDIDAVTWGWAGPYRAAHSKGSNTTTWGHLVVLGDEIPTNLQASRLIDGIRRMRSQLVAAGFLVWDHDVIPHQAIRDTDCPGPLYDNKAWWSLIASPLKEHEMTGFPPQLVKPTASFAGAPWFVLEGGNVRYAISHDVEVAKANGWRIAEPRDDSQYRWLYRSVFGSDPS